jgi:hypothetical protein
LGDLYITGFNLPNSVKLDIHPPPSRKEKEIILTFDPPVQDAFEVRERMFEWRDKAFEHFDVVSPNPFSPHTMPEQGFPADNRAWS